MVINIACEVLLRKFYCLTEAETTVTNSVFKPEATGLWQRQLRSVPIKARRAQLVFDKIAFYQKTLINFLYASTDCNQFILNKPQDRLLWPQSKNTFKNCFWNTTMEFVPLLRCSRLQSATHQGELNFRQSKGRHSPWGLSWIFPEPVSPSY